MTAALGGNLAASGCLVNLPVILPCTSAPPQLLPKLSVSERQALLKLAEAAAKQFECSAPDAERALSSWGSPTKRQRQEGAPSRPPQLLVLPLSLMGPPMSQLWVLGEDR